MHTVNSHAFTTRVNVRLMVAGSALSESLTRTVKVHSPTILGVPLSVPVLLSSVIPDERDPLSKLHERGAFPPRTERRNAYL